MCAVENPEQNLMSDYVELHVVMFSTDFGSSKILAFLINNTYIKSNRNLFDH